VDGEGDGIVLVAEVDLAEGPPSEGAVGADASLAVFVFVVFVDFVVFVVSFFRLGRGGLALLARARS
jgi:hypothetical protein